LINKGQELIFSCGTTQIDLNKSAHSPHTIIRASLITGEVPVRHYLRYYPFRPALISPFRKVFAAVIPPPTALFHAKNYVRTLLNRGFVIVL
jgi:hypothetical protein